MLVVSNSLSQRIYNINQPIYVSKMGLLQSSGIRLGHNLLYCVREVVLLGLQKILTSNRCNKSAGVQVCYTCHGIEDRQEHERNSPACCRKKFFLSLILARRYQGKV